MPDPSRPLADRVALVTGSSSGIGEGIARAMAEAGAKVVVTYHSDEDAAERIAGEIADAGHPEPMVRGLDASDEKSVQEVFDATVERFGRIDVVVANAGGQKDAAFAEMSLSKTGRRRSTSTSPAPSCAPARPCAVSAIRSRSKRPARAARSCASPPSTTASPGRVT